MPGYLESENASAMMKAMMLSSSCHDIRGDDTEGHGFQRIVEEDEERNCQIVRALGSGRNTRVSANRDNVRRVDTLTEPALPRGGGIITVNLRAFADPARRFLNLHYSEPIIIINQEGNAVSVPCPLSEAWRSLISLSCMSQIHMLTL